MSKIIWATDPKKHIFVEVLSGRIYARPSQDPARGFSLIYFKYIHIYVCNTHFCGAEFLYSNFCRTPVPETSKISEGKVSVEVLGRSVYKVALVKTVAPKRKTKEGKTNMSQHDVNYQIVKPICFLPS